MKTMQKLLLASFLLFAFTSYAQNNNANTSEEVVTKTIRIKGPNGQEKIIKKQEVIKKKSKIKFNPDDEDKTNQSAIYTDDEVVVKKSESYSDMEKYTKVPNGKGFLITMFKKTGQKVAKIRLLSNGYYIVNLGDKNNAVGHFDSDNNFIVESYDPKTDQIMTTAYRAN